MGVNSIFPDNYKKVLDNYAVKIGRAIRKAPAEEFLQAPWACFHEKICASLLRVVYLAILDVVAFDRRLEKTTAVEVVTGT